jgi:hypothetical protein
MANFSFIEIERVADYVTFQAEKRAGGKTYLAKKYETSLPNFYNWLKKNKITVKAEI